MSKTVIEKKQQTELSHALNTAATSLQRSAHSEDDVFRVFGEQVVGLGLRGGLSLLDESGKCLVVRAVAEPGQIQKALARLEKLVGVKTERYAILVAEVDAYRRVMETGEAVFVPDTSAVVAQLIPAAARPVLGRVLKVFGAAPGVIAPLITEGKVQGLLNLIGANLTADDIPAIAAFANHVAVALENVRLFSTLRESEGIHRLVLDNVDEIVYLVEMGADNIFSNQVRFVSGRVEQILGYQAEEFIHDRDLWFRIIHPDDAPALAESTRAIFASRQPGMREYRMRHKRTGDYHWLEDHVIPQLDAAGVVIGQFGVARDVTGQRKAEAALREREEYLANLMDTLGDAIFTIRMPERQIEYVNQALTDMFGYLPEEVIGQTTQIFYLDDTGFTNYGQRLQDALARGQRQMRAELELRRKDGERLWAEVHTTFLAQDGQPLRVISVVRDTTKRKRAEEERAQLYEQVNASRKRLQILSQQLIEAQEVERRHIARELHDEIGQVLTAVRTNLQTIQLSPDPSTLGPHLEESIGIVERALRQVRDLSLDLRPSLLDDFGLAPALEWYVDRQAERSGFTADFVAEPPEMQLSPALETACFRIAQAALTNVTRHAQAKRVRVELHCTETELRLVVRDDGIGFDVDTVLEHAAQGASFGLLGMRERTQLAGGQIEIESAPMNGTEIRVRFPLLPSAEDRSSEGA